MNKNGPLLFIRKGPCDSKILFNHFFAVLDDDTLLGYLAVDTEAQGAVEGLLNGLLDAFRESLAKLYVDDLADGLLHVDVDDEVELAVFKVKLALEVEGHSTEKRSHPRFNTLEVAFFDEEVAFVTEVRN